jgi:hypothetical protein
MHKRIQQPVIFMIKIFILSTSNTVKSVLCDLPKEQLKIWFHKTGGRLIKVQLIDMKCTVKGNKN